jgi:LemA protein
MPPAHCRVVSVPRAALLALVCALPLLLGGCGVNDVPTLEEEVNAAWAQVQNQYQRRADLIPNLVETVKGYAAQEREVLTAVTEARSRVGQMQIPPDILTDEEAFRQFQENQERLGSALSRLLVVAERYPELRSNENFLALQSQLEGTENRIAVARRDYIEAVQRYNTELRVIPDRWVAAIFHPEAEPMATFAATEAAQTAPQVRF